MHGRGRDYHGQRSMGPKLAKGMRILILDIQYEDMRYFDTLLRTDPTSRCGVVVSTTNQSPYDSQPAYIVALDEPLLEEDCAQDERAEQYCCT
jgi:hypothetical protein